MKLLVFAHTPPPHHGQSYMVQLMLEGFGGDARRRRPYPQNPPATENPPASAAGNPHAIDCYHVNARFSRDLSNVGEFKGTKMLLVLWFCLQALWIRFRYGVTNFYYVPAPGKRVALYRDWLVMLLCRPFFSRIILHWHAAGLAKWLETENPIQFRALTWRLFRPVDLSIVLSRYNFSDAQKLLSRKIMVVPVGVPDPCPRFAAEILPQRQKRLAARRKMLTIDPTPGRGALPVVRVLFLAHCTHEKGAFDTVEAVGLANLQAADRKSPLRFQLTLAGAFASAEEEKELRELIIRRNLQDKVEVLGFISKERKAVAFAEADIFCFPTYYLAENQPGNLIEAMAYGLPLITTRWRSIPEMLPANYPGIVNPRAPQEIAAALQVMAASDFSTVLRDLFRERFTLDQHLARMAEAIKAADKD